MQLQTKPIYVELGRRRQIVFDLNTEILIRGAGKGESSLWDTIGEFTDEKSGEIKRKLDVNLENLRVYLWAALAVDSAQNGELLSIEDVGGLIRHRSQVTAAVLAVAEALGQYYGDGAPGEA